MFSKAVAMLGLVAIAALAPMTIAEQNCQGWFDSVAGVCDSMGD